MKAEDDDGNLDAGDPDADDPLMPPAKNGQTRVGKTRRRKADAGKNGTGAGVELGEGTGTTPRATADDAENNEVDAKPGKRVSGDNSGMPSKAMSPTDTGGVHPAQKFDGDGDEDDAMVSDDDSTNGAQSKLPAKAKSPTDLGGEHMAKAAGAIKMFAGVMKAMGYSVETGGDGRAHIITITSVVPQGESQAGEGASQDADYRPEDNATDDDAKNAGGNVTGKVKGKTLDTSGIPDKAMSPTSLGGQVTKNDGDADATDKDKSKSRQLDGSMSGSGAQQTDDQTLKSDPG